MTGTVTRYRFANPHVYLTLDVKKPDGTVTSMEVEAGAASVLNGLGFNANSVKVGEVVSITGNPGRREPEKLLLGRDCQGRRRVRAAEHRLAQRLRRQGVHAGHEHRRDLVLAGLRRLYGLGAEVGGHRRGKGGVREDGCALHHAEGLHPDGLPFVTFYPVATTIEVQRIAC